MAELLLEVLSEDIPARMQVKAADDLRRLVTAALVQAGLDHERARAFATPRRLALSVSGLPARQPQRREEKTGPRLGASDKAVKGFLRTLGPGMSLEDCEIREDKKGPRYLAVLNRPGRPSPEVIAELIPRIIDTFPWPKSMRWGDGSLRWVRPLRSILCVFDGKTVPFKVGGLNSGHTTQGHRFMAPKPIGVSRLDEYEPALKAAKVMLDHDQRARAIGDGARNLASARGLELIEDDDLIAENAGLVEWPVILAGGFDDAFLTLPPEVIVTVLKAHQKCFALHDRKRSCRFGGGAALANGYIVVANIEAEDGGRGIVAGNDRVIAARLADARFFFDSDRKRPVTEMAKALKTVRFHQKLGSMADKADRVAALAGRIAGLIGADHEKAISAAKLAKADLVSGMVGEFPELQGVMGRYYALEQGIDEQICDAVAEHYRPQGVLDAVPTSSIAKAVAMADKLDTLIGLWAIDETPTGSRDPYALRRAAIGIIRIILDGGLRVHLGALIAQHQTRFAPVLDRDGLARDGFVRDGLARGLLSFFAERLNVYLRDKGARHDLVDAVVSAECHGDLVLIVRKIAALEAFLKTDDGVNLLAGVKRAGNILRSAEKTHGATYTDRPDHSLLVEEPEIALSAAIKTVESQSGAALAKEEFQAGLASIATLRQAIDDFFNAVMVNVDDEAIRTNRLRLLNRIRKVTVAIADFAKIEG